MKLKFSLSILILTASCTGYADCTYKEAQQKLMESNNILNEYKKKQLALIQNDSPIPDELNKTIDSIVEATANNGIALSEIGDPLKITYETKVPSAICAEYDRIIATYTPKDYKKEEIILSADNQFNCKGIKDTELWQRYGELIKKQPALLQSGKMTNAQATEISLIMAEFGSKMTTDFPAACALLVDAENKVNSYDR